MKRPRGDGLTRKVTDLLADAPRAMFLGEIESALEFAHTGPEIMAVLVKLMRAKKISASLMEREGPGRRVARAYSLSDEPGRLC